MASKTSQKTLNMFLGQPCYICMYECKKYSTLRLKLYDSIEYTYFTYFVPNANSEEMFIHLM